MSDECGPAGRAKRSPIPASGSSQAGGLNVETLVVADRKMLEKHGRENVTTYILTVMNMVSRGDGLGGEEERGRRRLGEERGGEEGRREGGRRGGGGG